MLNRRSALVLLAMVAVACQGTGTFAAQKKNDAKDGRVFMWKATKGDKTVYLLGSIHVAKPDFYPLPKPMTDAFEEAKVLVAEADVTKVDQAKMQQLMIQKGMYAPSDGLSKHLDEAQMKKLRDWAKGGGLPAEALEMFRPWALSLTILALELQKMGYRPDQGVDHHLLTKAHEAGKPVKELESIDQQIDLLAGLTDEQQKQFLVATLEQMDDMEKQVDGMVAAWKAGNAEKLEHEVYKQIDDQPEAKAVMEKLLDDRNVKMAEKIKGYVEGDEGTHLVVVGAAHLVGDKSLVKLLREEGMTVEQVSATGEPVKAK